MRSLFGSVALSSFLALVCAGCTEPVATSVDEGAFSSNQATLLDFEFDAELVTDSAYGNAETIIQDQLLYTMGHLNTHNSVGRLDNLELSGIALTPIDGGKSKITYHAKLPVAWGAKQGLPTEYELVLPKDVSRAGLTAFTEKHKDSCVDWGAHDVDTGSMWYYYRPYRAGCRIEDSEVVRVIAKASKSTENTTEKYPELHEVWKDNRLEVIVIFGKNEADATQDVGIDGFNRFVSTMKRDLGARASSVATTPKDVGERPGPGVADVTIEAKLADGKVVKVTAMLVRAITDVPRDFDARYESLTRTADLIAYNGHAGLGQNVRALARKGKWEKAKYQVFFINGCDSFAYVDGSLAEIRAELNPDDVKGTKYMEFVTNAMPSYFSSMPAASAAMVNGLLSYESPKTYDQIFENIDDAEVVLVTGEEDNVFRPGMKIGK